MCGQPDKEWARGINGRGGGLRETIDDEVEGDDRVEVVVIWSDLIFNMVRWAL